MTCALDFVIKFLLVLGCCGKEGIENLGCVLELMESTEVEILLLLGWVKTWGKLEWGRRQKKKSEGLIFGLTHLHAGEQFREEAKLTEKKKHSELCSDTSPVG